MSTSTSTVVEDSIRPAARASAGAAAVMMFSLTMLLGAFLLFFVQPMLAKMLLPKLGGSPAVWNTCMVFFQAALLAGYAYAHLISRRLRMRRQVIVHICIIALPLIVLPLALPRWNPPSDSSPIAWLLLMLTVMVGLPFVAISTGAPLLQKWFAGTGHKAANDPYFLYAASNIGSMLALVAYPIVIEPLLPLERQAKIWSVGYAVWAVLVAACAVMMLRNTPQAERLNEEVSDADAPPTLGQQLRWIILAFLPSSYLLGVTTFITTDIAAVPLLWIVPLIVYLLSFTLVFARRKIFSHKAMVFALPLTMIAVVLFMLARPIQPVALILAQHIVGLFVASMVCHGELARTRPSSRYLTQFYLMISIGGVLGGIFNALIAPRIFSRTLEYPLAIFLACVLCPPRRLFREAKEDPATAQPVVPAASEPQALPGAIPLDYGSPDRAEKRAAMRRKIQLALDILLPILVGVLAWYQFEWVRRLGNLQGVALAFFVQAPAVLLCMSFVERRLRFALGVGAMLLVFMFPPMHDSHLLDVRRSFFGVYRIMTAENDQFIELHHGQTVHGLQRADPNTLKPTRPDDPLSYYAKHGPAGQVLATLLPPKPNIGVVGLGTGTLAAYGEPGMRITFFEIDPLMRWLAEDSGYFNYIPSARQRGADVKIVIGDARLTLNDVPDGSLDVLLLDGFSGDAIPIHLLTREALQLYLRKLSPSAVLVVHISNRYLDLRPILAALARDSGRICVVRRDDFDDKVTKEQGYYPSEWIVIARTKSDLGPLASDPNWTEPAPAKGRIWTDDYSNLLSALSWRATPR